MSHASVTWGWNSYKGFWHTYWVLERPLSLIIYFSNIQEPLSLLTYQVYARILMGIDLLGWISPWSTVHSTWHIHTDVLNLHIKFDVFCFFLFFFYCCSICTTHLYSFVEFITLLTPSPHWKSPLILNQYYYYFYNVKVGGKKREKKIKYI